jgi:PHS family inorganic phosphate transporter-like MFS transporter
VRQQFLGLVIVAGLYAIWAGVTGHTSTGGLVTLFTLSQFFLNCGPTTTTFLIPVEVFPTRVRATAHGISAASGKAGAVLTSFAFGIASNAIGLRAVLGLLAGALVIAAAITLLIPEAKGRTLEQIEVGDIYEKKLAPDVEILEGGTSASSVTKVMAQSSSKAESELDG